MVVHFGSFLGEVGSTRITAIPAMTSGGWRGDW